MRVLSRRALILSSALALGALAQQRGRLVGVQAGGDAAASSIDLIGDRPLSFTTLKLHAPPRVVVDFADTDLDGIARETKVGDGTVVRVAAAAAGQRTARVVIELTGEAEFDVRAQGNKVQVRVPRIAAPQGVAIANESPEARVAREKKERAAAAQQAARDRRLAAADKAAADQRARAERKAADKRVREEKAAAQEKARLVARAEAAERKRAAQAAKAQAAKAKPRERALAMADARNAITGIGFRPIGAGEVIVRSDHPLEYGVSGDGDAVLLHLKSAAIPVANNRRPLDTHFFNGPVQRIVPLPSEDGTDVRIELRGHADYQLAQSGTVLTVTFSAPR